MTSVAIMSPTFQKLKPFVPQILRKYISERVKEKAEAPAETLTSKERKSLQIEIVYEVAKSLRSIKRELGSQLLPKPVRTFPLSNLDVKVRTYNCLGRLGVSDDVQDIGSLTYFDLLTAPNFGAESLIDLLCALEKIGAPQDVQSLAGSSDPPESGHLNGDDWTIIKVRIKENRRIPKRIRAKYFPALPSGFRFGRLNLSGRTLNRFEELGIVDQPWKLSEYTIDDILNVPNLGKKCLSEIITNLAPLFFSLGVDPILSEDYSDDLMLESSLLFNLNGAEDVAVGDIRFGSLIQTLLPDALNAKECSERILAGEQTCLGLAEARECIQQLRTEIEGATRLTLEGEILALISAVQRDTRAIQIFLSRYGLDGSEEKTLQQVGDTYGITRERVRQICDRVEKSFHGDVYAPTLDRVVSLIGQKIPAAADDVKTSLINRGVIGDNLLLYNLEHFAAMCGRELPFTISTFDGHPFISRNGLDAELTKILDVASKEIRTWGVALVDDVLTKTRAKGVEGPDEVVREILTSSKDFCWLDEQQGWFWLSKVRQNRLFNQIEKVFSVAKEIEISDLRKATRRNYRMKGFSPPTAVLLEFCRQQQGLAVDGQIVRVQDDYDCKRSLAETEALLVQILKENDCIMKREDFEKEAISRGMIRSTFYVHIDNSPVITRFARGVYGLAGAKIPLGLVESLKPKVLRGKVLRDFGWTRDGKIWIGYRLSESSIISGLVTLPSSLRRYIKPPYDIQGTGKKIMLFASTLGLGGLLSDMEAKVGDTLILVFDISENLASFVVGDYRLLEKFQSDALDKPIKPI